ncbi:ABC transporter permease [Paenibacillus fonticola]|uniref:ABC transporter permease n=1 Tax=Paenibacillus fonticola TaxID=379896 RepID=UPI00037C2715|nr:ABC transporter permease [Paenibacillus fonticola]
MIFNLMRAEGVKLKSICKWIPLIQGVILISMTALEWYLYFRQGPGGVYAGFAVMYMFLSFIMLLGTTLLTSILASTEHDTRTWKQLMTMPVPKNYIYWSKLGWVFILQLCTVMISIIGMCVIWLLYTDEPMPWNLMILQPLFACISSLPIMAIQLWLSSINFNQALPIAVGIFGSIASLFLARSNSIWIQILPWSYPALSSPLIPGHLQWIWISIGIGLLLSTACSLQFAKREFD